MRGWIGRAALRGDEPNPVQVQLDRWASATGRLVDANGKAVAGDADNFGVPAFPEPVSLTDDKGNSAPDSRYGNPWPRPVQTDNEGRFRSDGLVPGMTYELVFVTPVKKESYMVGEARTIETAVSSTVGEVIKGLSLAPGEVRDVATVHVESAKRPAGDGPK